MVVVVQAGEDSSLNHDVAETLEQYGQIERYLRHRIHHILVA